MKLNNFIRAKTKGSKKKYNLRLADQEKSLELTGFGNNGVCPIGMNSPIPMIVSAEIEKLDPQILYLGYAQYFIL